MREVAEEPVLHQYVEPPLAPSVIASPLQLVVDEGLVVIAAVGEVTVVTLYVAVSLHDPMVAITV